MSKSRMISVRVGEEEFRELKERCAEAGTANVSEFIRAAMLHALLNPEEISSVSLQMRLTRLAHRLDSLEERLREFVSAHAEYAPPEI